jgi:hypothetical protein
MLFLTLKNVTLMSTKSPLSIRVIYWGMPLAA